MTMRNASFGSTRTSARFRVLCSVLSGLLVGAHMPAVHAADRVEVATTETNHSFADVSVSAPVALDVGSKTAPSKTRTAPVSASGTLTHAIAIDVPPGCLGMTPSLALLYDSGAARKDSPVGAGWSFETSRISRLSPSGFPKVERSADGKRFFYDEAAALFESPDGPLMALQRAPAGTTALFAPLRELRAVRYEYRPDPNGGGWVEHDPSGKKRYFGKGVAYATQAGRLFPVTQARIRNELGTHSWLLVDEEDADGNVIHYDYYATDDALRATKTEAQRVPVLAKVSFGGNRNTGQPHRFFVTTEVRPYDGPINLLEGNVVLAHKIDAIHVWVGDKRVWTYRLDTATSPDTGRLLLRSITREAPGETPQTTRFAYSGNPGGLPTFAREEPLPRTFREVYTDVIRTWMDLRETTIRGALSPSGYREGFKFMDLNGDGATDVLYHPAGLKTPSSQIGWLRSYLQGADSSGAWTWATPSGRRDRNSDLFPDLDGEEPAPIMGLPDNRFTEVMDVDGDFDADGLGFDDKYISPRTVDTLPNLDLEYCFSKKFWNRCGNIDPDPDRPLPPDPCPPTPPPMRPGNGSNWDVPGPDDNPITGRYPCPLEGPDPPWAGAPRSAECLRLANACYGASASEFGLGRPIGESGTSYRVTVHANSSRDGVRIEPVQELSNWPEGFLKRVLLTHQWPVSILQHLSAPAVFPGGSNPNHYYWTTPLLDFSAPVLDVNGDAKADIVVLKKLSTLHKWLPRYTFAPRTYLLGPNDPANVDSVHSWKSDSLSYFGQSLRDIFSQGYGEPCVGDDCDKVSTYPPSINFNSFFLDVNGDALPDLVAAVPPFKFNGGERNVCVDGHRVYLNRGYRWERRDQKAFPSEGWSSQELGQSGAVTPERVLANLNDRQPNHPFRLLRNRDKKCTLGETTASVPMGGVSFTDMNADGRTDAVFAYIVGAAHNRTLRVFLNTGRGFREALEWASRFPDTLIDMGDRMPFAFARYTRDALAGWNVTDPQKVGSDLRRLVDLDADGLVDILAPAHCQQAPNLPLMGPWMQACGQPKWHRNLSVVPDQLTRIDAPTGTWSEMTYVAASSAAARKNEVIRTPGQLAPGQQVVARIRRGAGPEGRTDLFPFEEITLSYNNYVRDPVTNESIGFEDIRTSFQNRFDGKPRESLVIARTYDVRVSVRDDSGAPLPVRHPLKGAVRTTLVASGNATSVELSDYRVKPLTYGRGIVARAQGVRIREKSMLAGDCVGAACAWSGTNVLEQDEHGFPTRVEAGESDGARIVDGPERIETLATYEHREDSWMLGLTREQRVLGTTADIHGAPRPDRLLAHTLWTYTPSGKVHTVTRPALTPSGCQGPSEDVTTYTYNALGLVRTIAHAGKNTLTIAYDAANLYPREKSTNVTRYVDGEPSTSTRFATYLAVTTTFDERTGKVTRTVDPNGVATSATYDSRGRPLTVRGPADVLLEEHAYDDDATPSVTSTLYTDVERRYSQRIHLDGEGRVLGSVEGNGDAEVPFVRTARARYDAFGRAIEEYLPTDGVRSLNDYAQASDTRRVTRAFDGFGRVIDETRPDGTRTQLTYEARAEEDVDARGMRTRRDFDARGKLLRVAHFGADGALMVAHTMERDGLGRLLSLTDADGNVRRIERDLHGRTRFVELPHAPGRRGLAHAFCYDQDDEVTLSRTPRGDEVFRQRDELGRIVSLYFSSSAESGGFLATRASLSYDDPKTPFGLGRLTRVRDERGVTSYGYDAFGRPASEDVELASSLRALGPNLAPRYMTEFDYGITGGLRRAKFYGLPAPVELRYERDAKGRVRAVRSEGAGARTLVSEITYGAHGQMTGARFGNGTSGTWAYDDLTQRLDTIRYTTAERVPFGVVTYDYDPVGNIELEQRTDGTKLVTQKVHTYDALDRLETSELWTPGGRKRETYAYSPGGRLLSEVMTGSTATGASLGTPTRRYFYDHADLPQAISMVDDRGGERSGPRRLYYDDDGKLSTDHRDRAGGDDEGEQRELRFDPNGCLRHVMRGAADRTGAVHTTYVCTHDGRSVARKTVDERTGVSSSRIDFGGFVELRPHEGIALVRVPVNGTVTVEEARSLASGALEERASGYVMADARGSVIATSAFFDPHGLRTKEAEYDAWGNTERISELAAPSHGFVSHEPDPGLGYYHFGARAYDPTLRRWLSPDPLFLLDPDRDAVQGTELNLYAYARNNPVVLIDPTGLEGAEARQNEKDKKELAKQDAQAEQHVHQGQAVAVAITAIASTLAFGAHVAWTAVQAVAGTGQAGAAAAGAATRVGAMVGNVAAAANGTAVSTEALATTGAAVAAAVASARGSGGSVANAAQATVGSAVRAAEGAAARSFTSADPLVADLANAIERAYPGHVVGVNVPMKNAVGQLVTDADILLKNAVIQVKSGSGAGLTSQLARTQSATSLPVIGYGPNLGGSLVQGIQRAGGLVTRDQQLLIKVVSP